MSTKRATKRALLTSILAICLCLVMLVGSTFAWFADTASAGVNKIQAGNLKIDLVMDKNEDGNYTSIAGEDAAIFGEEGSLIAQNKSTDTLWEPGKTQIVFLGVQNKGNLAVKYNIVINVADNGLADALEYAIVDGAKAADMSVVDSWAAIKALANVQTGDVKAGKTVAAENGVLDEIVNGTKDETDYFALAVHMKEEAGNDYMDKDVTIDVTVTATQAAAESDSFGKTYDEGAAYPEITTVDPSQSGEGAEGTGDTDKKNSFEEAITEDKENIIINLSGDAYYDLNGYTLPLGGESTKTITINGNGNKIVFNMQNSDCSSVMCNGAKLTINNAVVDAGGTYHKASPWNAHDIVFDGDVEFNNVTFDNAVAVNGVATFKNCSIADKKVTSGSYMLWIQAGATVTLDNCTIDGKAANGDNRAIAIKDQYVSNPGMTTLTINGGKITSDKYAAVLVTSAGGANITLTGNVDISGTKDATNAVWYDGDGSNVTVNGCTKIARS